MCTSYSMKNIKLLNSLVRQNGPVTLASFTNLVKEVFGKSIGVSITTNGIIFEPCSAIITSYDMVVQHINMHNAMTTFRICMYVRAITGVPVHDSPLDHVVIDFSVPPEPIMINGFVTNLKYL